MNYEEAKEICERFALKHKIIFDDNGEVGFGRECVGFRDGDAYIDYNPYSMADYNPIERLQCREAEPPVYVKNAYHKHQCLAVLGHGEEPVIELAEWVLNMESLGDVRIEEYETGATGIQALMSGAFKRTVMIDPKPNVT